MIILRFSDFETDTITEHEDIIADRGQVWWGWWKKRHEPKRVELLTTVQEAIRRAPVRIALIDRVDRRYFAAVCDALEFVEERAISAPDPDLVPAYYRNRQFPAWFRISSIEPLTEAVWEREFGLAPSGDETIYETQRPKPVIDSQLIDCSVPKGHAGVLHLSDLHFGSDHGFKNGPSPDYFQISLLDRIVGSLASPPACVVVSGDLTTRAEDAGLRAARVFLEQLAEKLSIPRDAIVLVPGNHDIPIDDPELTRDYANELAFRETLQLFYGEHRELERIHDIRDAEGRHLIIGVLNSSRPRHRENMDYGYVGRDRSGPLFASMKAVAARPRRPVWSAVALHHHLVPAQLVEIPEDDHKRPISLCLDAGELVSLAQTNGVQTLLHGHQHLPFVASISRIAEFSADGATHPPRRNVHVLASGSTGVKRERIPGELGLNTFSLYRPFDRRGTKATTFAFSDSRNVHEVWTMSLPD